ncbi:guanylate kinase [Agriterribacter sp.]|uniref:guanylate kinase n=1 Tax=Agriterribacter sp. TaxID=2821509 RepID=UPI002BE5E5BB|nr:guanylate kinase [Agriterribacter sp.]HRO44916.1 guanylate kinase [Agriterribacter sp.]HRQ15654.1 guanylate kinase [Agriterribacter sp.]
MNQNKIIIITAPSGAGKTTIVQYLLQQYPKQLAFSISATTRERRANETDGRDYYFLSKEIFQQKIQHNEFVEWEMVYEGKYYGTLQSELERIWKTGRIPVLDIDVKGALHIQRRFPESSFSLFIQPPSVTELKRRLESRGTETVESLEARVNKAAYELSFKDHFNYTIVNNHLETACHEAEKIITGFF